MTERWMPVFHLIGTEQEGYYEVSDQGRVRSLDRTIYFTQQGRGGLQHSKRFCRGQILKTWRCGPRRERNAVRLAYGHGAREQQSVSVAVTVFEAFARRFVRDGYWIIHKNRVWHDDRLENLEEASTKEATAEPHRNNHSQARHKENERRRAL